MFDSAFWGSDENHHIKRGEYHHFFLQFIKIFAKILIERSSNKIASQGF
jgi:hypothetical protein